MTYPPAHRPDLPGSIAAMLGGMLCALLAALLGVARRRVVRARRMDAEFSDLLGPVLRAEAEADFTYEPWVEWVAVPAPWRNGRLLPRRHAAKRVRRHGVRPLARMRGPPVRFLTSRVERTGMA